MADEAALLRGNFLRNEALATPHDTPSFLRSAVLRVVAGSMLANAVMASLCSLIDTQYRFGCVLSAAVCAVAAWHYQKMLDIRSQSTGLLKLSPPGSGESGVPTPLRVAWQDASVDTVRFSDWLITLPFMIIELHSLINYYTKWFNVMVSVLLLIVMTLLGAYVRLGTDELVPPRKRGTDTFARVSGLVAYILACVCLALVLCNLLLGLEFDPTNGYVYVFSISWVGYGVVSLIAIVVRQFFSDAYPEGLSLFKDIAYGTLDQFSKGYFAFYVISGALGVQDRLF